MGGVGAEELPKRRTAMAGGGGRGGSGFRRGGGAHGWQCVTWGGTTGPREAIHACGGPEVMQGNGLQGGGHSGTVEQRERGQVARGGGAST
jgi:hypothetical protein